MTSHQHRILARRRAYCRALAHSNRALSFEDCEDVFAETLERDALGLPVELTPGEAHSWFSRRLQQRAIDFLRHRDGRRETEKLGRLHIPLDAPAGEDGGNTLAAQLPDRDADVAGELEAREDREQAIVAARQAMERLKPSEQRLLKLRYELPEASMQDLAGMTGLTVDQVSYRLRAAVQKFKKALSTGRLGPECDVTRGTLRMSHGSVESVSWARAEAHVAGCWMCRAWQLERTAVAWLPFPAFTKLEWLIARLEGRIRAMGPVPETAAGATAGGASVTLGASKLAALCGAGAVTATMCVGVLTLPEERPRKPRKPTPTRTPSPKRLAELPTPTPTRVPVPVPARAREARQEAQRPSTDRPTGQAEADPREVE
ncbi:MAG: sigma-70 family RNA polymerase sigma factor, partial [Candidatus Limnocylindria bacterium]